MNNTAEITGKDLRKIVRAGMMLKQVLDKLPTELRRIGNFDSASGKRAI